MDRDRDVIFHQFFSIFYISPWFYRDPVTTWGKTLSILEFGAPAFHSGLTIQEANDLEMIQKKAFSIILGPKFKNYSSALKILNQEKLSTRRLLLCEDFAIKCVSNSRHSDMFQINPVQKTRHSKKYKEPMCNTTRYYKSAIPFLTRLLNSKVC